MWNFAGRQNDIQGFGNKRDGNWISGFAFLDNQRLGNQEQLPDSIRHNKANNKLYLLPFILGMIGCIYQFIRNKKDWVVTFLLFFFTGFAIVLYLNQPGNQPRERDYAYVGSFYAFAIWIGLAVVAFVRMAREKADAMTFRNMLVYGSAASFFIGLMSASPGTAGSAFITGAFAAALYAAVTAGITYIVRAISKNGENAGTLNLAAGVICLLVPLLMAQQEWDDHDRSHKTTAPDIAKDYLESCAPNAIIFSFGDNDTYPLWYAQEVEGVRRDIRVINNSLLGIDWYVNQLRYKVNEADSVDVIWTPEQIEGHNREYLRYRANPNADPNRYYPLFEIMRDVLGSRVEDPKTKRDVGPREFPVSKLSIPVDADKVRKNGTVNPGDSVLTELRFEIPESKLRAGLVKSDLVILNILATNEWDRPIYFTSPMGELGFSEFLRKDGMAYRLVPVQNRFPQQNWVVDSALRRKGLGGTQIRDNNSGFMYENMMNKFAFGGANIKGVYFDEENRRHLTSLRALYGEAAGNLADKGELEKAQQLIDKCESGMSPDNIPYALVSRYNSHNQNSLVYLEGCYKAGKRELAEKLRVAIRTDLEQQARYFKYIESERPEFFGHFERSEAPINERLLLVLADIERRYAPETQAKTPTTEGPTTITTRAAGDSTGKPDSGNTP